MRDAEDDTPFTARLVEVEKDSAGMRLDRWFKARFPDITHGRVERLLRTGQIRLDGARAQAASRIRAGQYVRVPPFVRPADPPPPFLLAPKDARALRALVIYRDADILAINKPAGLAVQGGVRILRPLDAMLDALRFDAEDRPRLVHRLDKDTSGALLLARTRSAAAQISALFRRHAIKKLYWALVAGRPSPSEGTIETDDPSAETQYTTLGRAGRRIAWVAFRPITGRKHQIRAHAAKIGTPVIGDVKYGYDDAMMGGSALASGLQLHARALHFEWKGASRMIVAPVPESMRENGALLGFDFEEGGEKT